MLAARDFSISYSATEQDQLEAERAAKFILATNLFGYQFIWLQIYIGDQVFIGVCISCDQ